MNRKETDFFFLPIFLWYCCTCPHLTRLSDYSNLHLHTLDCFSVVKCINARQPFLSQAPSAIPLTSSGEACHCFEADQLLAAKASAKSMFYLLSLIPFYRLFYFTLQPAQSLSIICSSFLYEDIDNRKLTCLETLPYSGKLFLALQWKVQVWIPSPILSAD